MMDAESLKKDLDGLQTLANFQRGVRMALRSLWLFGAGVILAWGAEALWGIFPDRRLWFGFGLAFGLPPLVGFALSLKRRSDWVWLADRRLGLHEQLSTALETAGSKPASDLSAALVSDVLALLPELRQRLLRRGWFLKRDLLAASIVLILGGIVFSSVWIGSLADRLDSLPLAEAPSIDPVDPFPELAPTEPPAGIPVPQEMAPEEEGGAGESESESGGSPSESPAPQDEPSGDSPGLDPSALADALEGLGEDLSQQAPTYDLGQELRELDLDGAAGELDELNEQMEQLTPETRNQLREDFEEAAGEVDAAGDSELAEDLRAASEAIQGQEPAEPDESAGGDPLDQLAQSLRDRAGQMADSQANGSGAGGGASGRTGSPEPTDRLQGEGGDLELPLDDSAQSGLLSPAPPGSAGDGTASGSLDSSALGGEEALGSPLVPNSFLWKWRDVVSSYFQR